jgi:pimeloyl-ACP methyl ester carboxylesterase
MRQERFEFESHGESLAGVIDLPEGRPIAAVVTTGPLTSVKEQASGAYARALAERGFAALAFDHRYFGESGGRPRQFESPPAKIEDIRAAAVALADDARTRGLPLAAVGVCAGGGYMARAVADGPAVSAFSGVAGVYSDAAQTRTRLGDAYESMVSRARTAAERRFEETGEAETIPAVAAEGGGAAMPLREAYELHGTRGGAVPNYTNGFAVQSHAYALPFDAQGAAERITVPTLVVHSENALSPDLAPEFFARLDVLKTELWPGSKGQADFYDDPALIGPAADAIARFFAETVGSPASDV